MTTAVPTKEDSHCRMWTQPNANGLSSNTFVSALSQYPILVALVSQLRPEDLVPVVQTCQSIHNLLNLDDAKFRASLLTKTLCPGRGVGYRMNRHKVCETTSSKWHYTMTCGGIEGGEHVECRACVKCGINTCDECRIQVTYQCLIEDPGLDNRRWWAGFMFLGN